MADGSLIFDTKVDESGFKKGLDRLRGIASKSFDKITKAIKAGAAALSGLAVAAIKMGSDFEAGMSRVQALSGATGAEFEALRKTALELGRTTVFSASQAAEGMQYLAMAGFKTNEIIAAMPGVLNAAAAGQVDLATAADITSNVLSGFGLKAEEAARVADVLTKAFTSSNTTMESLGETMKYAAPVAAAAGFALEEVAAAAGMLGDAGIQGSQAGTTLRAIMLRLINPPKQAAEALDALGVSITDAEGKVKPLHQIIRELDKATQDMTDSQRAAIIAQIAGQEAASGLLAIMDMGADSLEQFTKELENAGGTAEKIANVQLDNLRGDIELLKSALEGTGITIYDSLDTPLRTVTQTLTGYVEEINKTLTAHDDIKAKAEELGVTVEELGINLAEVPHGIEGAIEVLGNILADMVTKVADFAPEMIDAASNLVMAFITGIKQNLSEISKAALDIMQAFITSIFEMVPEIIALGAELIVSLITGVAEMLPELITQGINVVITITDTIINNLPLIIDAGIQLVMALIEGIINNLPTIIQAGIQTVLSIIDGISQSLPQLLKAAIEIITKLAEGLIENLDLLLDSAIQIVEALISFVIENVDLLVDAALEIITALIDYLIDNLPMLVDSAVELVMAIVEGLINNIDLLVEAALELVIGIVQGLLNNLPLLVNAAIQLVLALTSGLLKMLPNLVETGIVLISRLIGAILGMIPRIISTGAQLLGELIIGIVKAIPQLLSLGPRIIQTIAQGIRGAFSGIVNVGKDIVRGLWDGIKSMFGWIGEKVKSIGSVITGGIKKVFGIASPSRVMKDEVGIELIRGIAEGIKQETPALRELTKQEMDKLISDYGRYGEEAVKKFAKLSKEEMDKIVQDSKKSGQDIAKAIAKGIEEKTHEITNALDKIRGETIKQLDRLGEATITALKRRYQEEERIQLEALQRQTENIRRETDKRIQEYDRELQAKLKLLNDNTNAELKQLQAAIDAINEKTRQEEKELREQEWQNRIAAKEKELIEAESAEERLKIQEELNKLKAERERELILEHRQMQIEALRAEMDRIRQQAAEKRAELEAEYQEKKKNEEAKLNAVITNLEKEMEATKQHYATLLEEEALQAEARRLLLDENNQELIDLLESYNPSWFDAGQSFGQSLLDGLNSMKYSIQQVVDEILGMVSTVDMANARIIQAKIDWHQAHARGDRAGMEEAHRRAEEARKQGGTIGADVPLEGLIRQMQATVAGETARISSSMTAGGTNTYSHTVNHNDYGITQHVTIVNPKGSPSENARQLKKVGRELALGY